MPAPAPHGPDGSPIEVWLTETALAAQLGAALRAGRIPEKFYYWMPRAAQAWTDLLGAAAYGHGTRSHQALERLASRLSEGLVPGPVTLVSLGAGDGTKDLFLAAALQAVGRSVRYVAVDSSRNLLETALARARGRGVDARGVQTDILEAESLDRLLREATHAPRLFLLLGNTLGVFDPARWPAAFAAKLAPADRLLVDLELFRGEATLASYDNPDNRRFAMALLEAVGIGAGAVDLSFRLAPEPGVAGVHRVEKTYRLRDRARAAWGGGELVLPAGTCLEGSPSRKFTAEAVERILGPAGGWRCAASSASDDGVFVARLLEPGPPSP